MTGRLVLLDEAGYLFGRNGDAIREALRVVPGIPNAKYVVTEAGVFVFEALLARMVDHGSKPGDATFLDVARGFVPEATVTPMEAVSRWGIVPEPYTVAPHGFTIQHKAFGALIPGARSSAADLHEALASLLVGDVVPGEGSFVYRGQPMQLLEDLDPTHLPEQPPVVLTGDLSAVPVARPRTLELVAFRGGFAPISEPAFDTVKKRALAWHDTSRRRDAWIAAHPGETERCLHAWPDARLRTLQHGHDDGRDVYAEASELRTLYPELRNLVPDGTLARWFDAFHDTVYGRAGDAYRTMEFLLFLIGKLASPDVDDATAVDVGTWTVAGYGSGASLGHAATLAAQAVAYQSTLEQLERRYYQVMSFLETDAGSPVRRGRPVTTIMDTIRAFRKCNASAKPSVVTQTLSDFGLFGQTQ